MKRKLLLLPVLIVTLLFMTAITTKDFAPAELVGVTGATSTIGTMGSVFTLDDFLNPEITVQVGDMITIPYTCEHRLYKLGFRPVIQLTEYCINSSGGTIQVSDCGRYISFSGDLATICSRVPTFACLAISTAQKP
jgi:hypothetical protein